MATPAETLALAAQYYGTGNLPLAEQFARTILAEQPGHAEALHLLGLIEHQKGNGKEAVDFLKRSLTSNESNPLTWQHLGDILLAAGELRGGITYYEQLLRLRPDFAEGYNTLGIAWLKLGEFTSAITSFKQAIRLAPTLAAAYNNLGNAQRRQGNLAEAAATLHQASLLWPDSPEVAYNLGNAYHDLGQLDQAIDCYRQALRFRPPYAADVSNSLASALRGQGLLADAIAQFKETLELRPDHAMASYNLAELAVTGHYTFTPEELSRVKALTASARLSAMDRSVHGFAAAMVQNHQGAYDEAFASYREANTLRKGQLQLYNQAFDARAHDALVDRIIATFGRSYFETTKKWGTTTDLPVFLIGLPGGGANIAEEILLGNPRRGAGEGYADIYKFVTAGTKGPANQLYTTHVLPNVLRVRTLAGDYLRQLKETAPAAARVTIRVLENYLHLGLIANLFSQVRIVHCRRDPLDWCLSCYFQNFHDMPAAWSLEDLAAFYRSYERLMAHWARVLPARVHEVTYEALSNNADAEVRALLAFVGLDWNEPFAASLAMRRARPTPQNIYEQPTGHWRHYRAHLGPLFRALGRSGDDNAQARTEI